MSSKQNKKQAQKVRKKETIEFEKELLKTQFPLECEALPHEDLEGYEQEIVNKCMNHEDLTDTEFATLKKILVKYRPAMEKYDVQKTVENTEKVVQIIKTEQELIDLFENKVMQQVLHLPIDDHVYEFLFDILPVTDSRVIKKLDTHLDLFKELNKKEQEVFNKAQAGLEVSREEQRILDKLTEKLESIAKQHDDEIIDIVLENQLRLHGSNADLETRRKFWSQFTITVKAQVFHKVQDRLGLNEYKQEELFPAR